MWVLHNGSATVFQAVGVGSIPTTHSLLVLGQAGFEPAQAQLMDLQSIPINHSGTVPITMLF